MVGCQCQIPNMVLYRITYTEADSPTMVLHDVSYRCQCHVPDMVLHGILY
ncbi:hypothetical protein F383_27476 [Gossypium arboreum]|uniref:Uncharacterized protein n=1 Tax=Gossypium arboreum TaxID=29729 RepID=A0A0B0MT89_GOSAR|nr:hypothetical protein F383_27476 [Gossypium arboreum]